LLLTGGAAIAAAIHPPQEFAMNKDRFEGNWKQLKGKARQQWGKLTDDHLDIVEGKREVLSGKIQEAYGVSRDEADSQIARWERSLRDDDYVAEERMQANRR
jgi:uncharacterized protein YjbJ (UPF0337 family)